MMKRLWLVAALALHARCDDFEGAEEDGDGIDGDFGGDDYGAGRRGEARGLRRRRRAWFVPRRRRRGGRASSLRPWAGRGDAAAAGVVRPH